MLSLGWRVQIKKKEPPRGIVLDRGAASRRYIQLRRAIDDRDDDDSNNNTICILLLYPIEAG